MQIRILLPIKVCLWLLCNCSFQPLTAQCWQDVAAGWDFTAAIQEDGTLWAWGENLSGQLGNGINERQHTPVQVGTESNWQRVATGESHVVAIKKDGSLWTWGNNRNGQLGDGTYSDKSTPTRIGLDNDWEQIAAARQYCIALKKNGTLWAWGGGFAKLFDPVPPENADRTAPTQVGTHSDWKQVSAGSQHILGIKKDGTLWACGNNDTGQLGDSTYFRRTSPVQIGHAADWIQAAAAYDHSMAIKQAPIASPGTGSIWFWGNNRGLVFANGPAPDPNYPIRFNPLQGWLQMATGLTHTIGADLTGTLLAWGKNTKGQLGDGTTITPLNNQFKRVQTGPATGWLRLAVGHSHSAAIQDDGTLWAWGNNSTGAVGDGTNIDRIRPERVDCSGRSFSFSRENLILSPNPVRDALHVTLNNMDPADLTFEVQNTLGQILIPRQPLPNTLTLDIQPLPRDFYLLHISGKDGQVSKLFVKW